MLKTLKELNLERYNVSEGVENLIKTDKMKYYTDQDWIDKQLRVFIITQDTVQDNKDREERNNALQKQIEKPKEENIQKESSDKFPLTDKNKIDGEVEITIDNIKDNIMDIIRSSVTVMFYDVKYHDKRVGSIKILNKNLRNLSVNPYEYVSCILSLLDNDINILLKAKKIEDKPKTKTNTENIEKSVEKPSIQKESLQYHSTQQYKLKTLTELYLDNITTYTSPYSERIDEGLFSSMFNGIKKAFSKDGPIANLFGSLFGKKDDKDSESSWWSKMNREDEENSKKAKEKISSLRDRFISKSDDKDFSEDDIKNCMSFFYDENGAPRSVDSIKKNFLKDVSDTDIQAFKKQAELYYQKNSAKCDAEAEWSQNLSKKERKQLDEQGARLCKRRALLQEMKRDDADIDTIKSEMMKLERKNDDASKKALKEMEKELEKKRSHRDQIYKDYTNNANAIKKGQIRIAEIHKNHPPKSPAELEKEQAKRDKDNYEALQKKANELAQNKKDMINKLEELKNKGESEGLTTDEKALWTLLCNNEAVKDDAELKDKYKAKSIPKEGEPEPKTSKSTQTTDDKKIPVLDDNGDPTGEYIIKKDDGTFAKSKKKEDGSFEEIGTASEDDYNNAKQNRDDFKNVTNKREKENEITITNDEGKAVEVIVKDGDTYKKYDLKDDGSRDENSVKDSSKEEFNQAVSDNDEDDENSVEDETGEDTNKEGKKVIKNPAKVWHKKKNKKTGKSTRNYYNAEGSSISPKEFKTLMKAFKISKKKKSTSGQGGNSAPGTESLISQKTNIFDNFRGGKLKTLED